MKIGFFGGAFNPPTNAHIELAKKAIKECTLDKVIFVPMGDFYEKKELAKAEDRLNMLKIICENKKEFEVSDLEIVENKKMCAIDAFRLIEKNYPDVEKFFIMGADNFVKITNWKESKELLTKYEYIVFERENIDLKEFINEILQKYEIKVKIVKNFEHKNTSSSKFRNIKNEVETKAIVPKEIFEYIKQNKIY